MNVLELLLRVVLSFVVLLTLTRLMGRKEISQMTFFNFVSAITIGTIGGALVTDSTLSIRNGMLALVGWAVITLLMGLIDIKSKKARKWIEGEPIIVIKKGMIMESALKKSRLSLDDLNALLREEKVFALADVDYAIFETDGNLSVMKKENKQTVTRSDMNVMKTSETVFPIATEVISDGKINNANLSKLQLDSEWLHKQLLADGIRSIEEVFYAEVQTDGSLYIDKRNDILH